MITKYMRLALAFILVFFTSRSFALENGYQHWQYLKSQCSNCDLYIQIVNPKIQTQKVKLFTEAISVHKADLVALYGIEEEEYNFLAQMAVGILGQESEFFTSQRYFIKESFPGLVTLLKIIQIYLHGHKQVLTANSRGPTQIKIVPQLIAQKYAIMPDELHIPKNAAIATMGFLIEALSELKSRIKKQHLEYIQPNNYVDYLPYIYFGRTRALVSRTAEPEKNHYVQAMKKYMMWVELYERPRSDGTLR